MARARRRAKPAPRRRPRRKPLPRIVQLPDGESLDLTLNPWYEAWLALTPSQRFERAWRRRKQLRDIDRIHDEKTYPDL